MNQFALHNAMWPADDPNGKLDITECSRYWLKGGRERGMKHICWDGCMFSNEVLETPETYTNILAAMIDVAETNTASL